MDRVEKDKVRLAIKDRIDELSLLLDREPAPEREDNESDEDAKVSQLITANIDSALLQSSTRERQALRRSLQWLESEDGGYCEQCGCEIDSARLLAIPSARTCIHCARQAEA